MRNKSLSLDQLVNTINPISGRKQSQTRFGNHSVLLAKVYIFFFRERERDCASSALKSLQVPLKLRYFSREYENTACYGPSFGNTCVSSFGLGHTWALLTISCQVIISRIMSGFNIRLCHLIP